VSFKSYAELQAAVLRTTRRTGDATFLADFPRQVRFAEQRINFGAFGTMPSEALRVRGMHKTVGLNALAGLANLPADYLAPVRLTWGADITPPLRYVTPNEFWELRYTGGLPLVFTVEGNQIRLAPASTGVLFLTYFAKFEAIETEDFITERNGSGVVDRLGASVTQRTTAQSNWLMENAPGVVMNAVLIESYRFLRNAGEMQSAYGEFMSTIAGINVAERTAQTMRTPAPRIRGATIR
jgi:hypothetical protein